MEAALQHEVQAQSTLFFSSPQTIEQVSDAYKHVTRKKDAYPRHLRVKVNTTGLQAVRYWGADKQRIDALESHAGALFTAKVLLRSLWFADDAWGLVCEATDLMQQVEVAAECPF